MISSKILFLIFLSILLIIKINAQLICTCATNIQDTYLYKNINIDEENPKWEEFKFRAGPGVLDNMNYLEKVTRKMVEFYQKNHVSGNAAPIFEQTLEIDECISGVSAKGSVVLHSGFVNSVEGIFDRKINQTGLGDGVASVKSAICLNNVTIIYDVEMHFEEYKGEATFAITIGQIGFDVKISQNLITKVVTPVLTQCGLFCSKMDIMTYPTDKYVQLTVKALKKSTKFCDNLKSFIEKWKIHENMKQATDEVGFAPVCLYCNEEK